MSQMYDNPYSYRNQKSDWSKQFGLYRYDDEKYKNVLNNRRNIRYFVLLAMVGFAITLVCLLIYENCYAPQAKQLTVDSTLLKPKNGTERTKGPDFPSKVPNGTIQYGNSSIKAESLNRRISHVYLSPPPVPPPFNRKAKNDYIENLRPPPPPLSAERESKNRRTFDTGEPHPFSHYNFNSAQRPQAFSKPYSIDREFKFAQMSSAYRPLKPMNIQDIIQYLTTNSGSSKNDVFDRKTKNSMVNYVATNDRQYEDPFYNYKPSNPSEINLLAPNKVRFAPVASYPPNHRPPSHSSYDNDLDIVKKTRKNKPFSVMLDIYPMNTDEPEENLNKPGTRPGSVRPTPQVYSSNGIQNVNAGYQYPNLNGLYHLSNTISNSYPNQISRPPLHSGIKPHNQIKTNGIQQPYAYESPGPYQYHRPTSLKYYKKSTVLGDFAATPQKMVVHLNLYPRKQIPLHRGSQSSDRKMEDSNIFGLGLNKTELLTLNDALSSENDSNCQPNLDDPHPNVNNADLYYAGSESMPQTVVLPEYPSQNPEIITPLIQNSTEIYDYNEEPTSIEKPVVFPTNSGFTTPISNQNYSLTSEGMNNFYDSYSNYREPETEGFRPMIFPNYLYPPPPPPPMSDTSYIPNSYSDHISETSDYYDPKTNTIPIPNYETYTFNYPQQLVNINEIKTQENTQQVHVEAEKRDLQVDYSLKNHKPFFTAVNRTLENQIIKSQS